MYTYCINELVCYNARERECEKNCLELECQANLSSIHFLLLYFFSISSVILDGGKKFDQSDINGSYGYALSKWSINWIYMNRTHVVSSCRMYERMPYD